MSPEKLKPKTFTASDARLTKMDRCREIRVLEPSFHKLH